MNEQTALPINLAYATGVPVTRRVALTSMASGLGLVSTADCTARTSATAPATSPDLLFVIPPGTAAMKMRGEPAFSLPPVIQIQAGQAIAVQNNDQAMHYFFSLPVAPGQTIRRTFLTVGRFGYNTLQSCSIADVEILTVDVAPPATNH